MVGTVVASERLTPTMVRVTLGGLGIERFTPNDWTDQYIVCQFVPDGAPYSVPFGDEADAAAPEHQPRKRYFTVRAWDGDRRLLTADFVVHGDEGHGGRWAAGARVGDLLQFRGPGGGYRPDADADWYLMAGDESALPAIAASLEVLPAGRPCIVLGVVDSPEHELPLASPADVEVRWLHRDRSATPETLLADALAAIEWRDGSVDVFVHGEASEVRAARKHLVGERGVDRDRASISPYWRRHHDDEEWRRVKRAWLAEQELDV